MADVCGAGYAAKPCESLWAAVGRRGSELLQSPRGD